MLHQTIRKAKIQSTSTHPKPFIVFRSAKLTPVSGDTKFQPGDTVQIWFDTNDKDIDTKRIIQAIQKQGKQISDEWNVYIKEAL